MLLTLLPLPLSLSLSLCRCVCIWLCGRQVLVSKHHCCGSAVCGAVVEIEHNFAFHIKPKHFSCTQSHETRIWSVRDGWMESKWDRDRLSEREWESRQMLAFVHLSVMVDKSSGYMRMPGIILEEQHFNTHTHDTQIQVPATQKHFNTFQHYLCTVHGWYTSALTDCQVNWTELKRDRDANKWGIEREVIEEQRILKIVKSTRSDSAYTYKLDLVFQTTLMMF